MLGQSLVTADEPLWILKELINYNKIKQMKPPSIYMKKHQQGKGL